MPNTSPRFNELLDKVIAETPLSTAEQAEYKHFVDEYNEAESAEYQRLGLSSFMPPDDIDVRWI